MQMLTSKMTTALGSMDLVAVNESMRGFEKIFDDLDVTEGFMGEVMDNVNAGSTDENAVKSLIGEVIDEWNMNPKLEFADVPRKNKNKKEEEKIETSNQSRKSLKQYN